MSIDGSSNHSLVGIKLLVQQKAFQLKKLIQLMKLTLERLYSLLGYQNGLGLNLNSKPNFNND